MVKFTPDCDCEGTGACATGAPAVAITSRSPAAVAGRQPTSPTRSGKRAPSRRPPERAPHPSPSRVKTKRAARRGEHPGRLTADDRLARASSCGASRRRLPESARKLDIPSRNLGALRAAKNFLKRLANALQLCAAGWRDHPSPETMKLGSLLVVTVESRRMPKNSFFCATFSQICLFQPVST